jgi:cobalt-zinc-cadmium efflux system outer membrane protein
LERATSTRAELRALDRLGTRADLERDAARRTKQPGLTFAGGVKHASAGIGHQTGGLFGVSLTLPLFDTGSRGAARWEAERVRVDAERASVEAQIRGEVTTASEALRLRLRVSSDEQALTRDDLLEIAEAGYRDGELGILELLDAARTSTRARLRGIDIGLDARLAGIALERAVGDVLWN